MPMPPDHKVPRERGDIGHLPIAADTAFGQNELVFRDAEGHAVPWSEEPGLVPLGVAIKPYDNAGGAAKAFEVEYFETGAFGLPILADDPVTTAELGTLVFAAGPSLVAKTDGGGTRPELGKLRGVYDGRAWIRFV
jgi:hypothetical protein